MVDDAIKRAKALTKKVRKSLIQQQTEIEPADPAALAESQVKNLDKFAKKLKKQYQDAKDQNIDAIKEIKFIDEKLSYLIGKNKTVTENLKNRREKFASVSSKLNECIQIQDNLMMDVKGRVQSNHQQMSRTQKRQAREHKEEINGFSIQPGSTCTRKEAGERARNLVKLKKEREQMVTKMRASGILGASLADMKKILANTGGILGGSESAATLPDLGRKMIRAGGTLKGSASTGVL
ncbi:hypothetical protein ScalyP_jg10535 [Parmales sp. scaly parma]|nr:hypothetical protein ScalyP_jg10535 [Parmales sp. scaly parma]|tara:strand:- start:410 stop:1120 length:711 start_codon:yes stop_codon:yes gene_type:complete